MTKPILFDSKEFSLQKIIIEIEDGELGLPDLQRPFKWKPKKVRELFDSMYKGFPVGTLLLWKKDKESKTRKIGIEKKQNEIESTILDGQQRLTCLYSVIKEKDVINEKFLPQKIKIAFNPKEEKFEVLSNAILRDPEWISNISIIWKKSSPIDAINEFIINLQKNRGVTSSEKNEIQSRLTRLHSLVNYPFFAFES